MAGTGTKIEQGWLGDGVAGEALDANVGVDFDTAGKIIEADAGRKGIGSVQEAYASGVTLSFYRKVGGAWLQTSGTVAAADYVKFTTGGIVIADTTSGSTALSVNTIGVVREVNAANSLAFVEWL